MSALAGCSSGRRALPEEFRDDVVRGYEVAKDVSVSPSCLKRWVVDRRAR
jgi:hypothetical protein